MSIVRQELVEKLSYLFPDKNLAVMILDYAQLNDGYIEVSGARKVLWYNILKQVEKHGDAALEKLLKVAINQYKNERIFFEIFINELNLPSVQEAPSNFFAPTYTGSNPFAMHTVFGDSLVFMNRNNFRARLHDLLNPNSNVNFTIIEGVSGSGLTRINLYISEVLKSFEDYQHVVISEDFNYQDGSSTSYVYGGDIVNEICEKLGINYIHTDHSVNTKYAPFFTKLKEYSANNPKKLKPLISIDGANKFSTPSVNRFLSDLVIEAQQSNGLFLAVICGANDRSNWPPALEGIQAIKVNSFEEADVKDFLRRVYEPVKEHLEDAMETDEFVDGWLQVQYDALNFSPDQLNVRQIGKVCQDWFNEFNQAL